MLLVFDRACAHGNIAQQVNEVLVVGRVEHLVGGKEASLLDDAQVHVADGLNAFEQVIGRLGVGVVQQALVAGAFGARLIGIDARNDDELVLDLLGDLGQSVHVLKHRVLAVGRARADDEHLACVLAGKDFGDLGVKCLLFGGKLGRKRHFLANLHGDRQPAFEFHGHRGLLNQISQSMNCRMQGIIRCRTLKCKPLLPRNLPKRDRFILVGFIWENVGTRRKGRANVRHAGASWIFCGIPRGQKMANMSTVASVVSYQPYKMIDTTVNMFINVGTQKPANGRFD